jgi:hypothetical protein
VTDHPTPATPDDVANDDQPAPVFNADVPHAVPDRLLSAIARQALLEAADRRAAEAERHLATEHGGPTGPEPTRYGDWEKKGLAIDF